MRHLAATLTLLTLVTPALAQQPSPAEQVQALQIELQLTRQQVSQLSLALARTQTALAAAQDEVGKLKGVQTTPKQDAAPAKP